MKNQTFGMKIFNIANITVLSILAILCILPLINVLAVSFSSASAATAGLVKLWPVEFTFSSYKYVLAKHEFLSAIWISVQRLVLGVVINMLLTILVAYPLSKSKQVFRRRSIYTWFFLISIIFNGGLIPGYMVMKNYGLIDSLWVLILPTAVPVFSIILLMNFFRELPGEIEEAAFLDGASQWYTLWKIYVPLSKPALATLILFSAVYHWNSWFDGLLFMNSPGNYPLQTYLQTVIISRDLSIVNSNTLSELAQISDRTTKSAQVFVGAIPILLVYPFLQRYFTKGLVLGSVKG